MKKTVIALLVFGANAAFAEDFVPAAEWLEPILLSERDPVTNTASFQIDQSTPEFTIYYPWLDGEPSSFGSLEIRYQGQVVWQTDESYHFSIFGAFDLDPSDNIHHILAMVETYGNSGLDEFEIFEVQGDQLNAVKTIDGQSFVPLDVVVRESKVEDGKLNLVRRAIYGPLREQTLTYQIKDGVAVLRDFQEREAAGSDIVFEAANYGGTPAEGWIDIPFEFNDREPIDFLTCQIWSRWDVITRCIVRLDDEKNIDISDLAGDCRRFGVRKDYSDEGALFGVCDFGEAVPLNLQLRMEQELSPQ